MTYSGLTVEYYINETGDNIFIPGNCQTPTSSHDNPDNGTKAERQAQCAKLSPDQVAVVAAPQSGGIGAADLSTAGSGYTEGSYNNVPVTGGSGSGATVDLQWLSGSWAYIIFQNGGTGYQVGDTVSVDPANVGGTGSGLTLVVSVVY